MTPLQSLQSSSKHWHPASLVLCTTKPSKGHSEEDSRSRREVAEEELDGKHHHHTEVCCGYRGKLLPALRKVISEIATLKSIGARHTSLKARNRSGDLDSVRQDGWKGRESCEQEKAYRNGNAE